MLQKGKSVIQVALILAVIPALYAQCISDDSLPKELTTNLYLGQQKFTIDLLQALQDATPNESIFFSPHSTYHALLLAYFGAKNNTEATLKKSLNLDWAEAKEDVSRAYLIDHNIRVADAENRSVDFNSVDKIFVADQLKVKWVNS